MSQIFKETIKMMLKFFELAKRLVGIQPTPVFVSKPAFIAEPEITARPNSAIEHAIKFRAAIREKLTLHLPDGKTLDLSNLVLGEPREINGMAYIPAYTS